MLTINKLLRPTGIRSYTIKAIKTDSISLVCLYSGSKLNKLGGYLRSSVLYTSKEKEIYIIDEDLFIIKETSGAGGDSIDTLSQNQDVEVTIATTPDTGIVSEEEVDSGTDAESTVEDEVPAPEVDIPEQIAIQKKRGRPPGPKNHVPEYVPRTTRSGRNNPTPTPNLTPEATLEPNNGYSHAISPLEEVQESTSQYRLAFYTAQEESPFLDDPTTLDQAMKRPDWPEWKKAVIKEYRSLKEKST
ncbi:hypothetical protein WAI453_003280 [Rhynchosporium graminicola]